MRELTLLERISTFEVFPVLGRISHISPSSIEADGPDCSVGEHCEVLDGATRAVKLRARVAAVSPGKVRLVPFGIVSDLRVGDLVQTAKQSIGPAVGAGFSGRAVNALGFAIDGGANPTAKKAFSSIPKVLDRISPDRPLETGIRAIDGFVPIGRGQRIGIFAASGVGKTSLLEQILRQADCERLVACLVGERGREVESLWQQIRASPIGDRAALVAATSEESAPMRAQAVEQAIALAEFWRDEGEDVLLVIDSVTRLAMALREIGLIAGEPPTARGFTPNVFSELPKLVERCGAVRDGGSISAVFTVLSETDDVDDPIVEAMKSHLDGHIVLSRRLAQAGHFPAIDISRSISRLFGRLTDREHALAAIRCRALIARYEEAQTLIESGLYKPGSDRELDSAVNSHPAIVAFLRQEADQSEDRPATRDALIKLAATSG